MPGKGVLEVDWSELGGMMEKLAKNISSENFDCLVCINRGGLMLGRVISDFLDKPLSVIAAQLYEPGEINVDARAFKLGTVATITRIHGDVLVIDDLSDTGTTFNKIKEHLLKNPDVNKVKSAAIFLKPWSKHKPNFYIGKTDKWVVFPYERQEFLREKGNEAQSK